MKNNQKHFNVYVFLSTFARNLIEVFIPLILYKYGYSLKEIVIYYLLINIFSTLLTYPCILLSKKCSNKMLSYIGIVSFILVQIMLNKMVYSYVYLLLLSLLYAIYRRGYWISRRYYSLKVIPNKDISLSYSIISIVNQIGVIISSYVGSLILDDINLNILTIISVILFLISTISLYMLKFEHEKNNTKIDLKNTIKKIPKSDLFLFGSYESLNVIKFLFPLYIFIYVKNTYQTVGILNLFANLSNILFVYLYGKMINNNNKNYLKHSIILVVIIYILKANITTNLLLVISFLEGIFNKMHELSISKEFYILSKNFEYYNYNLVYELTQNIFRTSVTAIILFFTFDVRVMIYISLFIVTLGVFFNFKTIDKNCIKNNVN